jgi:GNAT superfamily N-acetyltransferase
MVSVQTTGLEIRERSPEDDPAVVEIFNGSLPGDVPMTREALAEHESYERNDVPRLKLMAFVDQKPAGLGMVSQMVFDLDTRFRIGIRVLPEFRRRGIGKTLYAPLLAHAQETEMPELLCRVREDFLSITETWLGREGFREVERMRPSELDLEQIDVEACKAMEDKAGASDLVLTTLGEEDGEENRRKLLGLYNLTHRDVPHDVVVDQSYEKFEAMLNQPACLVDLLVIAKVGKAYAGFSIIAEDGKDRLMTWMTGVDPAYRNRGIASAVKARSALMASERGYKIMGTFNHINNPAMLAVNNRMGYVAKPEFVSYVRTVGDRP